MTRSLFALIVFSLFTTSCGTYQPLHATTNSVGPKRGKSCATYILPFHIGGQNTIMAAAKRGKISKISTVDTSLGDFFPFYYKRCTIVTGS